MNKCKKCGRCCNPIRLRVEITKNLIPISAPKGWMQKHWHLIKKEDNTYFYYCDFYDKKTHLCKIHKTKPDICKDYPYEKAYPDDFEKYTVEGCGYRTSKRKEKKDAAKARP